MTSFSRDDNKKNLSLELSEDVARWLEQGNAVDEVDHTANAAFQADKYRRLHGRSALTARAEIARNNGGFFKGSK